ncbi:hypothetical protein P8C59_008300 [Phyllachora maydis]|uniref:Lactosylceramide 4-alpha-galactosyltransferase n=1 Tax=Phyllachora maydis TaxID=1825666 RepID=A0AAD9IAB8_9PEZI|nr:hypothetical protein P8C59_008300 [Phyllachora maydis]
MASSFSHREPGPASGSGISFSAAKMRCLSPPRLRVPRGRSTVLTALLALAALTLLFWPRTSFPGPDVFGTAAFKRPQRFDFTQLSDQACHGAGAADSGAPTRHAIPPYVHYVWLPQDPGDFRLDFRFFVSAYSAHLLWRPDRILIHTDVTEAVFARAKAAGSPWTRRVLNLPGVAPHYVRRPRVTDRGVAIVHPEHQADFLRVAALLRFGGVYLDKDAVPLRPVAALLQSGFANVVGGATALAPRHLGYINNGVMMAAPNSTMMRLYERATHDFFDGRWETASILVLTDLAQRMAALPAEVLILHPLAFAPVSWEHKDQERLFLPRMASPPSSPPPLPPPTPGANGTASCGAALARLREDRTDGRREARGPRDAWELDFSGSYVLHAFDDAVGRIGGGWDRVVDVRYVLARRSNYARAVYPAVRHAVDAGLIPPEEVE